MKIKLPIRFFIASFVCFFVCLGVSLCISIFALRLLLPFDGHITERIAYSVIYIMTLLPLISVCSISYTRYSVNSFKMQLNHFLIFGFVALIIVNVFGLPQAVETQTSNEIANDIIGNAISQAIITFIAGIQIPWRKVFAPFPKTK